MLEYRKKKSMAPVLLFALLAGAALAAGYWFMGGSGGAPGGGGEASSAAGQPGMQAMPVEIEVIENKPVRIWKKFSGRLVAVDYVLIHPQVSGKITEIRFQDGQNVQKGDILMVIDPRPYAASVRQAEADVAAARNQLELATKELQRANDLIGTDAISRRLLDERSSTQSIASSNLKSAQARLEQARINLDYAYVKAPISGRVSRAEVTVGNLVQSGAPDTPLLTSIVSDEGIYADFEIDEQTYLNTIRIQDKNVQDIPVHLTLPDSDSIYEGKMQSFDNHIDPASGTIRGRAIFSSEGGLLLPGMFVNVSLGGPENTEHVLVSSKAVSTDQDRKYVYVVDEKNMVAYREVKLGDQIEGKRIVLSGLQAGDRVVVDGLMMIRPGMPVTPMSADEMAAMRAKQSGQPEGQPATEAPATPEEPEQSTQEGASPQAGSAAGSQGANETTDGPSQENLEQAPPQGQ